MGCGIMNDMGFCGLPDWASLGRSHQASGREFTAFLHVFIRRGCEVLPCERGIGLHPARERDGPILAVAGPAGLWRHSVTALRPSALGGGRSSRRTRVGGHRDYTGHCIAVDLVTTHDPARHGPSRAVSAQHITPQKKCTVLQCRGAGRDRANLEFLLVLPQRQSPRPRTNDGFLPRHQTAIPPYIVTR